MSAPAAWKQRPEGGGRRAIALIAAIARHGGRGIARLCLYPITLYFLVMRGPERRASRAWLSRVRGRRAGVLAVARHIHCFASTILDRLFLLGGQLRHFDIHVHGLAPLEALVDQGRGVLLFGSHLGSFDALRILSRRRPGLVVRIVLDRTQNPVLTELFDRLDPVLAAGVIDGSQDGPSIALEIQRSLEDGALVALLVDRSQPHEDTVPVPFVDGTARFPLTPWRLAVALHAPVLLCFGLYAGGNRYDLYFEPFLEGGTAHLPPRAQRARVLGEWVARYATRLEHHARRAPTNWFNFFDFWNADVPDAAPHAAPRPVPQDPSLDAAAVRVRTAERSGT